MFAFTIPVFLAHKLFLIVHSLTEKLTKLRACSLQETFAKEGLQYNMDGLTGNTLNSHRLIAFAGQEGLTKQNALVDALFKAYFTEVRS